MPGQRAGVQLGSQEASVLGQGHSAQMRRGTLEAASPRSGNFSRMIRVTFTPLLEQKSLWFLPCDPLAAKILLFVLSSSFFPLFFGRTLILVFAACV